MVERRFLYDVLQHLKKIDSLNRSRQSNKDAAIAAVFHQLMADARESRIITERFMDVIKDNALDVETLAAADSDWVAALNEEQLKACISYHLHMDHLVEDYFISHSIPSGAIFRLCTRLYAITLDPRFVFFHRDDEENGYLSNRYPASFTYARTRYFCVQQYIMAQKALVFDDRKAHSNIMASQDISQINALGRSIRNYDDRLWSKLRCQIMRRGVRAKFQQNEALLRMLLATDDRVIVNNAQKDRIWGNGLASDDPRIDRIGEWTGHNLLGRVLMQVRSDLRQWLRCGDISYVEAENMESNSIWQLSFIQAMQLPGVREMITYPYVAEYSLNTHGHSCPKMLMADGLGAIGDFEEAFFDNMGGGLPIGDLPEMRQDVFDMTRFGCV